MRKICPKCRSKIDGDGKELWWCNVYCIFAKKPYIFRKEKMNNKYWKSTKSKNVLKDKKIEELKQQQLYKEDFKKIANTSYSSKGHTSFTTWELKDNSLYDRLPSKEKK